MIDKILEYLLSPELKKALKQPSTVLFILSVFGAGAISGFAGDWAFWEDVKEGQIDSLKEQLSGVTGEKDSLQRGVAELEQEKGNLEDQNSELTDQTEVLREENQGLKAENSALQTQVIEAESRNQELRVENEELQVEANQLNSENSALQAQVSSHDQHNNTIQALEQQKQQCENDSLKMLDERSNLPSHIVSGLTQVTRENPAYTELTERIEKKEEICTDIRTRLFDSY